MCAIYMVINHKKAGRHLDQTIGLRPSHLRPLFAAYPSLGYVEQPAGDGVALFKVGRFVFHQEETYVERKYER